MEDQLKSNDSRKAWDCLKTITVNTRKNQICQVLQIMKLLLMN